MPYASLNLVVTSTGVAGCCAKSTVAPFDRVKILLQAHHVHYRHLGRRCFHGQKVNIGVTTCTGSKVCQLLNVQNKTGLCTM